MMESHVDGVIFEVKIISSAKNKWERVAPLAYMESGFQAR